jgi:hypothetical protein
VNRFRATAFLSAFVFPVFLSALDGVPQLSLEDLAGHSDTIVEGQVVRTWTAMDSENRFIWTHYELRVGNRLKGDARTTVEIGEPGGTLNGVTLLVPGGTPYKVGEQVSVFLYRTPIGYLRTTNYGQGKFILPDGASRTDFRSRVVRIVSAQQAAQQGVRQ